MRTRTEHVAWCRQRALAELDAGGDIAIPLALASLTSDLTKHPDTADHSGIELGVLLAMNGHLATKREMREWIEGIS